METRMNRSILMCVLFAAAAAALGAQEASQPSPYQGISNPPPDEMITTPPTPQPKPPAGQPMSMQPAATSPALSPVPPQPEPQAVSVDPSVNAAVTGNDYGIVQVASSTPGQPAPAERAYAPDPDGDIVHPQALPPGELGEGTTLRVKLLDQLSTTSSERGEPFHTRVATDVLQGGQVLIPAGAEIDGSVVEVSSGHVGGHGTLRLRPETVILPNGSRYQLQAAVFGTPGSRTHVDGEGTILPNSRLKRDGIEYGGGVGAGLITGAVLGGPVGALTGSLIGAGAVTAHLLISHPQATLEPGTTLLFTLTDTLNLIPASPTGN